MIRPGDSFIFGSPVWGRMNSSAEGVADAMARLQRARWLEADPKHNGWEEHRAIVASIRVFDIDRAVDLLETHLRNTCTRLIDILSTGRRTPAFKRHYFKIKLRAESGGRGYGLSCRLIADLHHPYRALRRFDSPPDHRGLPNEVDEVRAATGWGPGSSFAARSARSRSIISDDRSTKGARHRAKSSTVRISRGRSAPTQRIMGLPRLRHPPAARPARNRC